MERNSLMPSLDDDPSRSIDDPSRGTEPNQGAERAPDASERRAGEKRRKLRSTDEGAGSGRSQRQPRKIYVRSKRSDDSGGENDSESRRWKRDDRRADAMAQRRPAGRSRDDSRVQQRGWRKGVVKSDKVLDRRNRRLFGVLRGHLSKAKSSLAERASLNRKKREVEAKVERRVQKMKQEAQELSLTSLDTRESHEERLSKYIKTVSEPRIYWLPAEHNSATLALARSAEEAHRSRMRRDEAGQSEGNVGSSAAGGSREHIRGAVTSDKKRLEG